LSSNAFLRILCIGLAIVASAAFDAVGAADHSDLPAAAQSKINVETWRRFESGEIRDLLVLFGDAVIDAEMQVHLAQRRMQTEDATALTLRANRYQQLKQPVLSALSTDDAEPRRDYRHLPLAFIRFKNSAVLLRMLARKEVLAVADDLKLYPVLAESLPLIGQPSTAQVISRTGAGTTVAVLDSGIDYTRSEFGSCMSPAVPAGCRVAASLDIAPDDGVLDDIGHGTLVSGVIAATAPGTRLAVLDVFSGGSASASDILAGIDWVIANRSTYNIVAINMSLGDGVRHTSTCNSFSSNPFRQAIINARNAGILTVAASGNDAYLNGLSNPACTPEAVSVGAVYDANAGTVGFSVCSDPATAPDQVVCFSNSASFLTLLAPGAMITTAGVTTAGTSFAAPFVSAAVAVLASAFPSDTPAQRLARATSTGKPVTDARNGIIKPRLDLLAAQGPPSNNALANAVTLSGASGQVTGWNFNATQESGEPNHAGVGGGKSVWWQWTAPASGNITLDTHGSGFNTLLAVYSGTAANALTSIAGNDDDGASGNTSGLTFHANAGAIYRIAVDGSAGAQGAITLNYAFAVDPPPYADLSITLVDAPDPVPAGAIVTYILTVTNQGTVPASGVVATLNLPAGAAVVSAAGCTQSPGVVICSLGTLAAGQQSIRGIQAILTLGGVNQAQASVSTTTPDTNTANNTVITPTTVNAESVGGDVPLPAWALVMLVAALWRGMMWRSAREQ
jgi:uncharacterized repeat protein (TIGR01451 family)